MPKTFFGNLPSPPDVELVVVVIGPVPVVVSVVVVVKGSVVVVVSVDGVVVVIGDVSHSKLVVVVG